MPDDVIHANEIWLTNGTTTRRFPIVSPMRHIWAGGFPGKVVTGDVQRENDPIASSHIFGDFSGGLLVYRMVDVQQFGDRYWVGTLDTRFREQTPLLPLSTATQPSGLTTSNVTAGVEYTIAGSPQLYCAWETTIKVWNEATGAWTTPSGYTAGSHDLSTSATDAVVAPLNSGTDWLVFCDGNKYVRFNGTTWTLQTGNGSTVPTAKLLTTYDSKLWAIDQQNYLWYTTDLSAANDGWVKQARLPAPTGEVVRLLHYFLQDGTEQVMATSKSALWAFDDSLNKWYRTRMRYPRHPAGGLGVTEWLGDLYISAGTTIYKDNGQVISNVGLDRDWGLEKSFRGDVRWLENAFNWLIAGTYAGSPVSITGTTYAGTVATTNTSTTLTGTSTRFTSQVAVGSFIRVNGTVKKVTAVASDTSLTVDTAYRSTASGLTASQAGVVHGRGGLRYWVSPTVALLQGYAALFASNGTAWHPLWTASIQGTGITWLRLTASDNVSRLWWGAANQAYYQSVPRGVFNPQELADWQYAPSGYLTTPWFEASWPEQTKTAVELHVRVEGVTSTETCAVYYGVNGDPAWYLLTTLNDTTGEEITAKFSSTAGGSDGRGLPYLSIRLQLVSSRGGTTTRTPVLRFAALRYLRRPDPRYYYQCTVDCADAYDYATPAQLATDLRALMESGPLLTFAFWRNGQELVRRKVAMSHWEGQSGTGPDTSGSYQISLVEA